MNTHQNLIIANNKIITPDIIDCKYNKQSRKYNIKFKSGKIYTYSSDNIIWLNNTKSITPSTCRISRNNKKFFNISAIYEFSNGQHHYWHICFENGYECDYEIRTLDISVSCLSEATSKNVFEYLKEAANLVSLRTEDGTRLLSKQYDKIDFVSRDKAFSVYLDPVKYWVKDLGSFVPIFPFGCNASQYKAVKNALENQISVIQGPPGTGKTQTILNIIANLLIAGKTMQVVSNNNSATENILEKLSSPEYNLGFLVAPLGNASNKARFLADQEKKYPDIIQTWNSVIPNKNAFFNELQQCSKKLNELFNMKEQLAKAKQKLGELNIELKYFMEYTGKTGRDHSDIMFRKKLKSGIVLQLWQTFQNCSYTGKKLSFFLKLKCRFIYGISYWSFFKSDLAELVTFFQLLFYTTKKAELIKEIEDLEKSLTENNQEGKIRDLTKMSMRYLKKILYNRYGTTADRKVFSQDDLWKHPEEVQKEYPVVLSTTHSARSSLCKDAEFDFIIIDEASQVDVATGALALSCAKNAVIVGDSKQLPNVVNSDNKMQLQALFDSYQISRHYNFAEKSFLQSVCDGILNIPETLLREHYRCHPKIINFCNQKFYGGKLVIMTKDSENDKEIISVIKTVKENHERNHVNQRQIDSVVKEVLPELQNTDQDIGIIAPYKKQVTAMSEILADRAIDIATVHKFQGREKDAIIITTVDNVVTDFSDDPNLLNVAISRAKKSLHLVVSGNDQPQNSNIADLINYIQYNNFTVGNSKVRSVFDYLYSYYTNKRIKLLQSVKKVSKYDSENLMYKVILDVFKISNYSSLNVLCHMPLRMLIRDPGLMDEEERCYAMNHSTHLDFLIYNKISKKPVLAVEVDGYHFHKKGTLQAKRDIKKNRILELYGIPLIRFMTNGSGEEEKLSAKLQDLYQKKTSV